MVAHGVTVGLLVWFSRRGDRVAQSLEMDTLDCCEVLQSSHPFRLVEALSVGTTAVVLCCSVEHGRADSECCRCHACFFPLVGRCIGERRQTRSFRKAMGWPTTSTVVHCSCCQLLPEVWGVQRTTIAAHLSAMKLFRRLVCSIEYIQLSIRGFATSSMEWRGNHL